jgi:SAM-dependent methyltransferase
VNQSLLSRWLDGGSPKVVLKTDAFDEAVGKGPWAAMNGTALGVCLDVSPETLKKAASRNGTLMFAGADTRRLPIAGSSIDCVLSLSTLDHFSDKAAIRRALSELFRVLRPGGTMVLTLDNPANPAIRLRNALPKSALYRTGLVPYRVGETFDESELRMELSDLGFEIRSMTHVLHCPRLLAVPLSRAAAKLPPAWQRGWLSALYWWEWLERLPTSHWTGHYVAALARKPAPRDRA